MSPPASPSASDLNLPFEPGRRYVLLGGALHTAEVAVSAGGQVERLDDVAVAADDPAVGTVVVCPRPLDLHVHGGGGYVVGRDSLTPVSSVHAPACWVATVPVPGTGADALLDQIAHVAQQVQVDPDCVGMRIEGLFLNPEARGVWPAAGLHRPDVGLLAEVAAAAGGQLRIVDIAPELPGALDLITRARELGLVVSMAHTVASADEAQRGIDAGITLATHTFNAMPAMHHRSPGAAVAALLDSRVVCELIHDGHHVDPRMVALAMRVAGAGRIALISDASPLAGGVDGAVGTWAGADIILDDGRCQTADGRLAGSGKTLMECLRVLPSGVDVAAFLEAACVTPWRALNPDQNVDLAVGDAAVAVPTPDAV